MTAFHLGFDLRYYPAYQGFEGSRSGATVFRPNQSESLRYSNLTQILVQKSEVVSQITLIFENEKNESAIVKARMTFDSPLIDWEVNTEAIPVGDKQGKEVTVNFRDLDMDNVGTLYTDQSGLEMGTRVLGMRMNS